MPRARRARHHAERTRACPSAPARRTGRRRASPSDSALPHRRSVCSRMAPTVPVSRPLDGRQGSPVDPRLTDPYEFVALPLCCLARYAPPCVDVAPSRRCAMTLMRRHRGCTRSGCSRRRWARERLGANPAAATPHAWCRTPCHHVDHVMPEAHDGCGSAAMGMPTSAPEPKRARSHPQPTAAKSAGAAPSTSRRAHRMPMKRARCGRRYGRPVQGLGATQPDVYMRPDIASRANASNPVLTVCSCCAHARSACAAAAVPTRNASTTRPPEASRTRTRAPRSCRAAARRGSLQYQRVPRRSSSNEPLWRLCLMGTAPPSPSPQSKPPARSPRGLRHAECCEPLADEGPSRYGRRRSRCDRVKPREPRIVSGFSSLGRTLHHPGTVRQPASPRLLAPVTAQTCPSYT